jgi:hypothetical protein
MMRIDIQDGMDDYCSVNSFMLTKTEQDNSDQRYK